MKAIGYTVMLNQQLAQAIPSSGPGSGLPAGQNRDVLPKQANMTFGCLWCQNNSKVKTLKIFISPGNHKSSANQPLLILPNSDEQYNGKGKTGRPEISITASYL